ncbi:WG repeat-containing protein [Achromobacter sp. B7]|uniref:WG repeat-containing protein n=1 Tax=Achromobacter sp. B7 TaxID=2282475 RepID=UPI000E762DDA|nr:WG repeat-containing protein [Achromobacter sp. B7]AYD66848.1 WG repeat-containing protein [Achromobacter sp. B7]
MMRAAIKPLALALALALPTLPVTARAESWLDQCTTSYYGQGSDPVCHQPFSEGLAAVLTGSRSDEAGAWGYIDKQGRMAIAPAYRYVMPFQNGVAAASQGELWGYIDPKGQWVIKPRYTNATGFNAEGTALVEEDERDVLIDRQGKVVKTFPLGTRTWGFMPGQKLASIEMPTPPRLINTTTGAAAELPEGVMMLAAPSAGYLPAQVRGSRYSGWWGLLDAQGRWAVTPQVLRSREAPMRDGDVVAVRRDEKWTFVNPRGEAISSAAYERVQWLAPGVWLVASEDGKSTLLDGRLKPTHAFTTSYMGVQQRDGWRYLSDASTTLLISPAGTMQKLAIRDGRVDIVQGRAWVYGMPADGAPRADGAGDAAAGDAAASDAAKEAAPVAVEASDGNVDIAADAVAVDAADNAAAAAAGASDASKPGTDAVAAVGTAAVDTAAVDTAAVDTTAADTATVVTDVAETAGADQAAAGAEVADTISSDDAASYSATVASADGSLVQVYAADGKPLLDSDTAQRLRGYDVSEFSPRKTAPRTPGNATMPLALLRALNGDRPLAILTATGKIVSNPQWENIDTYNVTMPLVVRAKGDKVGAIDGQGKWAVPPEYSELRPFNGPYTWARTPDMLRRDAILIDAQGKPTRVPDEVGAAASDLDGDLLVYRAADDNRERRWGLWNVRLNAPALKPDYERIEEFDDDWVRVQDKDRWGVVNRQGQWVVPAKHDSAYGMEYLGNGVMLVSEPEGKGLAGRYGDSPYRMVNLRTGKHSDIIYGKPDKLAEGRYIGQLADGSAVLFDAQGRATKISDGRPESKEQHGEWLIVRQDEREGAIDARGNLQVPALYGEFNPFFVQPEGLARVNQGSGYRVIDQQGKTVLEKRGDGFPLASMRRVLFTDDSSSTTVLTDLQGREVARLSGRYPVEYRHASEGVVPYSENYGKYGFLDAAGKRVVGAHFSVLGPLKHGLARAQRLDRTGKLYGFIDLSGRYAIPPAYNWAQDFQDERAMVFHDHLVEFIDPRGKTTTTFGVLCDQIVIFDAEENQSWPREALTCSDAKRIDPPALDSAKAE